MDVLSTEQRHKNMSNTKCKNTKIEIILRKALWNRGLRYRIHCKKIPGNPDIVFGKCKIAIFCDGEFYHGYKWSVLKDQIGTNRDFWLAKIERNIQRDIEVNKQLEEMGWVVLRFWGNEIKKNTEECVSKIISTLEMRAVVYNSRPKKIERK
jgi:DNA mismatch endonuclease (patch repair protein)